MKFKTMIALALLCGSFSEISSAAVREVKMPGSHVIYAKGRCQNELNWERRENCVGAGIVKAYDFPSDTYLIQSLLSNNEEMVTGSNKLEHGIVGLSTNRAGDRDSDLLTGDSDVTKQGEFIGTIKAVFSSGFVIVAKKEISEYTRQTTYSLEKANDLRLKRSRHERAY